MNNKFLKSHLHMCYLFERTCTLWPQTALEFLAVLHEKIKTNIHLISINAFKKYEQYF